jgi:UPF0755 protein
MSILTAVKLRRSIVHNKEEEQVDTEIESPDKPKRGKTVLVVISSILVIICLIIGIGLGIVAYVLNALSPTALSGEPVQVLIEPGTNSSRIAVLLEENGLIRNERVFTYYLRYKNEGSRFQAGLYEMHPGIELDEIISKLNRGDTVKEEMIRFTIPEGYTLMQMADKLSQEELIDRDVFVSLLANPEQFTSSMIQNIPEVPELLHRMEGYLFPETYEMKKVSTEHEMIKRMLEELDNKLGRLPDGWEKQLEKLELSFHELMTIASLVEREVIVDEERRMVAGVIYNRLEINMPLQIDATVQYALDKHKERLLYVDLEVDSPYNTYKVLGLPPGPIASPSLFSIEAALYPEETPYFYYVTKKDGTGEHYFGITHGDHERNIAKSKANVNE